MEFITKHFLRQQDKDANLQYITGIIGSTFIFKKQLRAVIQSWEFCKNRPNISYSAWRKRGFSDLDDKYNDFIARLKYYF